MQSLLQIIWELQLVDEWETEINRLKELNSKSKLSPSRMEEKMQKAAEDKAQAPQ